MLEKSEEEKVELQQKYDQSEIEKAELRRQNDCLQEVLEESERRKCVLQEMLEKSEGVKDKLYQEKNRFQTLVDNEVVKNSKLMKNQGRLQAVLDQSYQLKRENGLLLARVNDLEQYTFLHRGIREISHLSRGFWQLYNNFCKLTLNETSNGIGIHHWYGIPKEISSILSCGGCGECMDCKRIILELIKPNNEVVKVGLFQGELCTREIYGVVEGLCFSASGNVELKIEKWGRGIKIRPENIECLGTQFLARLKIIMPKRQEIRPIDLLYNVDVKSGDGCGCEVSVFKMEGSDRGKEVISKNKIYGWDREIRDYKVEDWFSPECQYIEMSWKFRFRQTGDTLFIGYPVILLDGSLVDIGQSAEYKFLDLISVDQPILELKNVPKKLVKRARSFSDVGEELKSHLVFVDYESRRVIDKERFKLNIHDIGGKDSLGVLVNGVLEKVIVMTGFTNN